METTAKELIDHIEEKLQQRKYTDSVHKIKLITTREMILKILSEKL